MVKLILSGQTEERSKVDAGGRRPRSSRQRGGVDEVKLSLFKKFVLRINGSVYVGHRTRPGWSGSLPFYVFECPVHGLVENYPQGYHGRLDCPLCLQEKTA
jgi:hypothetical protein